MKARKVVVIGGGASGLMAAVVASRNGAQVEILEQMSRVGKKILATGNGRCNLTNINSNIKRFHGKNPKFAMDILNQFDPEKTMEFFEYLGVHCKVEEGGKVYPASDQASSVLDVLRYEVERLGILETCDSGVKSISTTKDGFTITLRDGRSMKADRVILATGGKASPNLGSNGSGYNLVIPFGHKMVDTFPALVQLVLKESFLKSIKGVRFMGKASIGIKDKVLREEWGEVLFTDYGISGPAIFQLSRKAGEELNNGIKPWIMIDMFPEESYEDILNMLRRRFNFQPNKPLDFSFIGLLNKRLINVILKEAGIQDIHKEAKSVTEDECRRIAEILKAWTLEVQGTQAWGEAQVTAGGIDVSDINPKNMESKIISGLYFSGEVLDIDGDCGGFNLQWAWSSGYVAGLHAAID